MKIYNDLGKFVEHIWNSLGRDGKCIINCTLKKYRDAEGIDYSFEASSTSLGISYKTGNRISHDERSSDDGNYLKILKQKIEEKGLSKRVTFE